MIKSIISTLALLFFFSFTEAQLPLLATENEWFVNALTKQKVILKGIDISNNVWGFYEWPISDSLEKAKVNPLIRAREMKSFVFTSEDVERIAQLDGNVVRYCFNDELFRADNPKRQSNIAVMRKHISLLAAKGIYSIVTMQINPGLDVHNDNYERTKPGNIRLKSPFESDSVFELWQETWQYVAKNLKDMDEVAGYEIINEPRRPSLVDASEQNLVKTYIKLIDVIRAEDNTHIVMVPEFNSREANPGEEYYDNEKGRMVSDQGEQGTIWGRNWLKLPATIPNLCYVAHLYDPFEFTSGKTATTFNKTSLQNTIYQTANWAYTQKRPVYISEYGTNYFHTMNGQDAKRTEWLRTMHDAFDANHISSTVWQYKELITPWVKMDETFGIWLHYYDETTIKSVSGGKVEYSDEQARTAAIKSKIDPVLNEYFIEDGKFVPVSMVNNQSLFAELKRYFATKPLGIDKIKSSIDYTVYVYKESLYFTGLPENAIYLPLKIVSTDGKILCDTALNVKDGKMQLPLSNLQKSAGKIVLVSVGEQNKAQKVLLP